MENYLAKYRWIFLVYFVISLIILGKLFLMPGMISGGDWGFPDNISQLKVYLDSLFHSWTHVGNIFGGRQLASVSIIFFLPLYLFALTGISLGTLIKIVLVLIFALAATNFNLLMRYIKIKPAPAFIGGLVFILTPIFFDYSLMGWIYVLLSLAMLPLFIYLFLRAVDEKNYRFAFLSAIIATISMQPQTIVWYSLAILAIVLWHGSMNRRILQSLLYAGLMLLFWLLLNSWWLIPLIIFPDKGVSGSNLVNTTISIGTSDHFYFSNILRGWGSLFNYQFETSYPKVLLPISFVLPALAFLSLFNFRKFRSHIGYFILVFLSVIIFWLLDRNLIAKLPFANVIRDLSRFTTISTFALAALATIALDWIFSEKTVFRKLLIVFVLVILFINSFSFFSGAFFSGRQNDADIRFRTKTWPSEYQELNQKFNEVHSDERVMFMPIGGIVSLSDDKKFHGMFQELADVYASLAPISGAVSLSDRSQGTSAAIVDQINGAIKIQDVKTLMRLASANNINLLVFRRDMDYFDWGSVEKDRFEQKLRSEVNYGSAEVYYDKGPILAISLRPVDPLISVSGQNSPMITYKRISPAKYEIDAKNISSDFKLAFNENHDSYWKLISGDEFDSRIIASSEIQSTGSSYGNWFDLSISKLQARGALLEDSDGNQNTKFYLIFWPEKYVFLTGLLSVVSLFLVIFLIFFPFRRPKKQKVNF